MKKRRHTVTDIVGAVYCEQKAVFDKLHGKVMTDDGRRKAAQGTFEHTRFEVEGYTRNPARLIAKMVRYQPRPRYTPKSDARCFIATAIYGPHAEETNALRDWRDAVLMPSWFGRVLVGVYYRLSPPLARILGRSMALRKIVQQCLDALVKRIGRTP